MKNKNASDNRIKLVMPSFGLISGVATFTAFFPHALIVLAMLFFYPGAKTPASIALVFTVTARILGDWIFWFTMFPQEMDSGKNRQDWRSSVRDILVSQPPAIKSMLDMVIDAAVDVTLVYMAYRASASPMWVLFIFSACQAIGALIHGYGSHFFNRKNLRLFSMIVTALATFLAFEINGLISITYTNLLGLSKFAASTQMLIVLGSKSLLAGTTVIAKTNIAAVIKIETASNAVVANE